MNDILIISAGFLLDMLFGDPKWLYHPVIAIGKLISFMERGLRKLFPKDSKGELAAGFFLAVLVPLISWGTAFFILFIAKRINLYLYYGIEIFMCFQIFAMKSLKNESMNVYEKVQAKDFEGARTAVGRIVGRDTKNLDFKGITKAAVETVAENLCDGVTAPMFFIFIGGAPLGFFYKAVNTMDSMVGYKNEKYFYFGKVAARLDDVMNFIPSRLSAFMIIASAFMLNMDYKNAWKVFKKDRLNHKSPNSAQTESAAAGALRVELAGNAYYFGELYEKPTIGKALKEIEPEDIPSVNKLLYASSILFLLMLSILKIAVST
ncbi:adenosylcobinamide-phosphate synthase CbiB [Anaeropeptidivorans aminofermentans]|uniref:adenosylcobinamide-phosphate synthase CbiB n=1 Tax=Anaeropeptidivorans aminofermentans TaxID=2934315 RepID=UPI002025A6B7|nr:adenosylcobinamide-phosphate synthase CbiB [Anaeropeptidivorans aminofermentans]